jgi:glutamine amidotransferase
MGNLGSIANVLQHIGVAAVISSDPEAVANADRAIIPGIGAFDQGMLALQRRGLNAPLDHLALKRGRPVLGICLGMQLLCNGSEEGSEKGLGWIDGFSRKLSPQPDESGRTAKIPHMGWNFVTVSEHPLFESFASQSRFYFVHSYHVVCSDQACVVSSTSYGGQSIAAAVNRGNIAGTQFHPEKSHRFGMQLLRNFSKWRPAAAH